MNILKLIEQLEKARARHGDNANVYLAVDEEGNDFKPVEEVSDANKGEGFTNNQSGKEIVGIILWPKE